MGHAQASPHWPPLSFQWDHNKYELYITYFTDYLSIVWSFSTLHTPHRLLPLPQDRNIWKGLSSPTWLNFHPDYLWAKFKFSKYFIRQLPILKSSRCMSSPRLLPIRRTMNAHCPLYRWDRAPIWQPLLTLEFETEEISYLDRNISLCCIAMGWHPSEA